MIVSLLTVGLLLIPSSHAFWRMPCNKPVLNARADPIVAPGGPSDHAHTIMGSSAIGYDTTFNDLIASNCTTCMVNDDRSAYWAPEMYYQYANGSFEAVDHGGMTVYYLQRNGPSETVVAFPDGLRMLTGDPYARSYSGSDASQAISWLCLDYSKPYQPQSPGFTSTVCPDGLRAQIFFPGCWDGMNLDSSDHRSHMAYPSGIDNGQCPSSHPVHLISIFYELWFSVDPFNQLNDGGRFVLANGDPTGYGLHGDFMDGWNKDVLSRAIETCTNDSGVIEDCPVFANENRFVPDAVMNSCSAPNPMPSENVQGPIPYLPGCVAISDGPAEATADLDPNCVAASGNPGSVSSPPQNTSSSSMPASSSPASPLPSSTPASGNDTVPSSSSPMPSSSSTASPPPSTTSASGGYSVPSTSDSMSAASSPANSPPSTTPSSGDNSGPSSSSSTPAASSPASPSPSTTPSSGDGSGPSGSSSTPASSSPASPPSETTPDYCDDDDDDDDSSSSVSTPVPTQPPSNAGPSPSSTTPAQPPASSPSPMTSNTPTPSNPPSGDQGGNNNNNAYNGNGNGAGAGSPSPSSNPSPSSSPASGGPSSMDPGTVSPTTATTEPSSPPPKQPTPSSSSSPPKSSGNHHDHHGHHQPQQQEQQNGSSNGNSCSGSQPPKKARDVSAKRPMRRRHHARRAAHGSYMHL